MRARKKFKKHRSRSRVVSPTILQPMKRATQLQSSQFRTLYVTTRKATGETFLVDVAQARIVGNHSRDNASIPWTFLKTLAREEVPRISPAKMVFVFAHAAQDAIHSINRREDQWFVFSYSNLRLCYHRTGLHCL